MHEINKHRRDAVTPPPPTPPIHKVEVTMRLHKNNVQSFQAAKKINAFHSLDFTMTVAKSHLTQKIVTAHYYYLTNLLSTPTGLLIWYLAAMFTAT